MEPTNGGKISATATKIQNHLIGDTTDVASCTSATANDKRLAMRADDAQTRHHRVKLVKKLRTKLSLGGGQSLLYYREHPECGPKDVPNVKLYSY